MKTIQVQYDYGITTSDKGNAVVFFDIIRPDGKVCRNYAEGAVKRAKAYSKILGHSEYMEIKGMKKLTDDLYLQKNK